MSEREFLSERSVAEFFDTSPSTVRRWIDAGVLPTPSVIGGLKRWHVDDLRRAAGRGLDAAATGTARSDDPDVISARILRHAQKARDQNARKR